MQNIGVEYLYKLNPWWKDPHFQFHESKFKPRFIWRKIEEWRDKKFIFSLSGLRRLGKTTVFRQFIQKLLNEGKEPRNIFFYEFSESDNNLRRVLEDYFDKLLNVKNLYNIECYIFLDELQYVKKWQVDLKFYYDINPYIRFFSYFIFIRQEAFYYFISIYYTNT